MLKDEIKEMRHEVKTDVSLVGSKIDVVLNKVEVIEQDNIDRDNALSDLDSRVSVLEAGALGDEAVVRIDSTLDELQQKLNVNKLVLSVTQPLPLLVERLKCEPMRYETC